METRKHFLILTGIAAVAVTAGWLWLAMGEERGTAVTGEAPVGTGTVDLPAAPPAGVETVHDVSAIERSKALPEAARPAPPPAAEIPLSHEERPFVVGRLLDPEGEPLRSATVDFLQRTRDPEGGRMRRERARSLRTDDDGRYRFDLKDEHESGQRVVEFRVARPEGPDLVGEVDVSFRLSPGDNDRGETRLEPAPLLVSGVVVDADGMGLAGAGVSLQGFETIDGRESWVRLADLSATTDADGAFRVDGVARVGILRVMAHLSGYATRSLRVPSGTPDVRLVMVAAGSIEGQVVLGPGIDPPDLRVGLQLPGQTHPSGKPLLAEGSFRFTDVHPGSYTVQVFVEDAEEILWQSERFDLEARETVDFGEIDLRETVQLVRLRFLDSNRVAITQRISLRLPGDYIARGVTPDSEGWGEVLSTRPSFELQVMADGYGTVSLVVVGDGDTIVLPFGIPYEVRLDGGGPVLSEYEHLSVSFLGVHPHHGTGVFDRDGTARLTLPAPGEYDIRVTYAHRHPETGSRSTTMRFPDLEDSPWTVSAESTVLLIEVSEEELAAARRELGIPAD